MKYFLKLLLITLVLSTSLFAEIFNKPDFDPRLNSLDARAIQWWNNSDTDSAAAFNIGLLYDIKLKDYKKAELWYKQAINIEPKDTRTIMNLAMLYDDNLDEPKKAEFWYKELLNLKPNNPNGLFNLALLYKAKFNNPKLAIKWYEKAYKNNHPLAAYNLAYLYKDLKKYDKAIVWYEKAIKMEDLSAIKNLGRLYHYNLKDDIKAAEYFTALIGKRYTKKRIVGYLKEKWKLSDETIKKGYEAQLKSKIIPEKLKYKGGI
ncbi:sel1 repeat family protein [Sulfurimonas lithotrophica]|uniref:beta-lactamase n=1 Tax=Sulfurimonas lithotrophica TaxID=2590022 RepID=A0A5P8NZQ1_9BACT|nr:tetratricopeptide repeat protein [Sulfurimonas lithotrophica]QFR48928.1 sel1 repeat family protein [Sulfurimonas lithotrophica]